MPRGQHRPVWTQSHWIGLAIITTLVAAEAAPVATGACELVMEPHDATRPTTRG